MPIYTREITSTDFGWTLMPVESSVKNLKSEPVGFPPAEEDLPAENVI
jgi:hypothetical protein